MTDFGETDAVDGPRAEMSLHVRRQLNEFSPFEEVFTFRWVEPEVSQVERSSIPRVSYSIVRESRNGIPGFDSEECSTRISHPAQLPDDVLERAEAMLDWAEIDLHGGDG